MKPFPFFFSDRPITYGRGESTTAALMSRHDDHHHREKITRKKRRTEPSLPLLVVVILTLSCFFRPCCCYLLFPGTVIMIHSSLNLGLRASPVAVACLSHLKLSCNTTEIIRLKYSGPMHAYDAFRTVPRVYVLEEEGSFNIHPRGPRSAVFCFLPPYSSSQ